jgi:DNA-binding Lrp family transcriptional regulator
MMTLTEADQKIIVYLYRHGPSRIAPLAEAAGVHHRHCRRRINALQQMGVVLKKRNNGFVEVQLVMKWN